MLLGRHGSWSFELITVLILILVAFHHFDSSTRFCAEVLCRSGNGGGPPCLQGQRSVFPTELSCVSIIRILYYHALLCIWQLASNTRERCYIATSNEISQLSRSHYPRLLHHQYQNIIRRLWVASINTCWWVMQRRLVDARRHRVGRAWRSIAFKFNFSNALIRPLVKVR